MQIYTSYFYKVRFFTPNMIPISTAKSDPRWFHNFKDETYTFLDKRGVVNGLRAPVFAPGRVATAVSTCGPQCDDNPTNCPFMDAYWIQLKQLDFNDIIKRTETLCQKAMDYYHIEGEPIAVFLVHEAPDNPCSERRVIQDWFKCNGIEVKEWEN